MPVKSFRMYPQTEIWRPPQRPGIGWGFAQLSEVQRGLGFAAQRLLSKTRPEAWRSPRPRGQLPPSDHSAGCSVTAG